MNDHRIYRMVIEIVDLPSYKMVIFYGVLYVYESSMDWLTGKSSPEAIDFPMKIIGFSCEQFKHV